MDWYEPENAHYKMADELTLLCEKIAMQSNVLVLSMDHIEKFNAYFEVLTLMQQQLQVSMRFLQLAAYYNKPQQDDHTTEADTAIPLALQDKINQKGMHIIWRMLQKKYTLQEIAATFSDYGIALTEYDIIKLTEEN